MTEPVHDEVGWAYGVIYDELGSCGLIEHGSILGGSWITEKG